MRNLLTTLALTLVLGMGTSLPAAASRGDDTRTANMQSRPTLLRIAGDEQTARPPRVRLARATSSDAYDHWGARSHRRSTYRDDGVYRKRYTKRHAKRRHARSSRHLRRHQRSARRAGVRGQAAAQHRRRAAHRRAIARHGSGLHGIASYYWQPQRVASGGWFNPNALTAAHKTLPFGSRVRVTHLGNGRSVEVKINDRGPFVAGRVIDLSRAAAGILRIGGLARVKLEVLRR